MFTYMPEGSRAFPIAAAAVFPLTISLVFAAEAGTPEEKIALAMQAAPPSVSAQATVIDMDGTVLREGSNGWTCLPGDDVAYPMCNDAVWMNFVQAITAQEPFETDRVGISYMLAGDRNVNNFDPFDSEPGEGEVWVQEGPHLMIIMPDQAMLEGITDDPDSGGPYVMWKDTPYAHIMLPTAERSE